MAMLHATEAFTRWLRGLKDRSAQAVIVERLQRVARGLEDIAKAIRLAGML